MTRHAVVLTLLLGGVAIPVDAQPWIEARSANYSIFYEAGYEADAEFARKWMDASESIMLNKYGVTPSAYHISFYLFSSPTTGAGVGTASIRCCYRGPNGKQIGEIRYLAPSATGWKNSQGKPYITSLGLPYDDDYHAKVIISEYISVGHQAVQNTRSSSSGWGCYGAGTPSWFVQGLQEYDALFYSTDGNRTRTWAALIDWTRKYATGFVCCSTLTDRAAIAVADAYRGGALFVAFLAAQYGEDFHGRMLRNRSATFDEALAQETKVGSVPELFELFRGWFGRGAVVPSSR